MTLTNSFFSFLTKYKVIILIVGLLYLVSYFYNIKEGFTSCSQFRNCIECVNGRVLDTSSPCYWSSEKKKCGSFNDPGYSRLCYPGPTPGPAPGPGLTPGPGPGPTPCPICKECPELTLLKNPTFITKQ